MDESTGWQYTPEEDADIERLLMDIAFEEREMEDRVRYGDDLPLDEPTIDVDIHDDSFVITRRRITGMEGL